MELRGFTWNLLAKRPSWKNGFVVFLISSGLEAILKGEKNRIVV